MHGLPRVIREESIVPTHVIPQQLPAAAPDPVAEERRNGLLEPEFGGVDDGSDGGLEDVILGDDLVSILDFLRDQIIRRRRSVFGRRHFLYHGVIRESHVIRCCQSQDGSCRDTLRGMDQYSPEFLSVPSQNAGHGAKPPTDGHGEGDVIDAPEDLLPGHLRGFCACWQLERHGHAGVFQRPVPRVPDRQETEGTDLVGEIQYVHPNVAIVKREVRVGREPDFEL